MYILGFFFFHMAIRLSVLPSLWDSLFSESPLQLPLLRWNGLNTHTAWKLKKKDGKLIIFSVWIGCVTLLFIKHQEGLHWSFKGSLNYKWTDCHLTGDAKLPQSLLKINNLSWLLRSGNQIWQKEVIARYDPSRSHERLSHIIILAVFNILWITLICNVLMSTTVFVLLECPLAVKLCLLNNPSLCCNLTIVPNNIQWDSKMPAPLSPVRLCPGKVFGSYHGFLPWNILFTHSAIVFLQILCKQIQSLFIFEINKIQPQSA